MKRYVFGEFALGALALAGCVQTEVPMSAPVATSPPQMIHCDDALQTMGNCWDEADKRCPHGFFILDADGKPIPKSSFDPFTGKIIAIAGRAAMIQCHDDPAPTKYMPRFQY